MTPDWREQAVCRDDPDLFFQRDGERGHAAWRREQQAKAVCVTCPVVASCLEAHLDERFGVFGGTSARERDRLRRQQRGSRLGVPRLEEAS